MFGYLHFFVVFVITFIVFKFAMLLDVSADYKFVTETLTLDGSEIEPLNLIINEENS